MTANQVALTVRTSLSSLEIDVTSPRVDLQIEQRDVPRIVVERFFTGRTDVMRFCSHGHGIAGSEVSFVQSDGPYKDYYRLSVPRHFGDEIKLNLNAEATVSIGDGKYWVFEVTANAGLLRAKSLVATQLNLCSSGTFNADFDRLEVDRLTVQQKTSGEFAAEELSARWIDLHIRGGLFDVASGRAESGTIIASEWSLQTAGGNVRLRGDFDKVDTHSCGTGKVRVRRR